MSMPKPTATVPNPAAAVANVAHLAVILGRDSLDCFSVKYNLPVCQRLPFNAHMGVRMSILHFAQLSLFKEQCEGHLGLTR